MFPHVYIIPITSCHYKTQNLKQKTPSTTPSNYTGNPTKRTAESCNLFIDLENMKFNINTRSQLDKHINEKNVKVEIYLSQYKIQHFFPDEIAGEIGWKQENKIYLTQLIDIFPRSFTRIDISEKTIMITHSLDSFLNKNNPNVISRRDAFKSTKRKFLAALGIQEHKIETTAFRFIVDIIFDDTDNIREPIKYLRIQFRMFHFNCKNEESPLELIEMLSLSETEQIRQRLRSTVQKY
ncbi:hypothetical protein CDIK_1302 [Cucumispora dikerogammari]|nr:hypothetical protein CDIK_1302 [Cucumispora dikerogammari]